jgi:hypothetical protein
MIETKTTTLIQHLPHRILIINFCLQVAPLQPRYFGSVLTTENISLQKLRNNTTAYFQAHSIHTF